MDRWLIPFAARLVEMSIDLTFSIVEIGGRPLGGHTDPFYCLLDVFPGSKILSFEPDPALCDEINRQGRPGLTFYPTAISGARGRRPFYLTRHPMCASLYRPNEDLLRLYQNFEVAYLERVVELDTISLDDFARDYGVESIDFIKIDIQGAEYEVFAGAKRALQDVVAIVSEVEFIPHYVGQKLFGDICQLLGDDTLMFHKFLGLEGRTLRPVVMNNNLDFASQHIWSDAMFIRHVQTIGTLSSAELLKLSVFAHLYGSPDLCHCCLSAHDQKFQSDLCTLFWRCAQ